MSENNDEKTSAEYLARNTQTGAHAPESPMYRSGYPARAELGKSLLDRAGYKRAEAEPPEEPADAAPVTINFPQRWNTPLEFQNIPFNEEWLTLDGLPFGLEDWALQFMEPGDYGAGTRVVPNNPPHEPIVCNFTVRRDWEGGVHFQYQVSDTEYFTLTPNEASKTYRNGKGGGLTMAKWMPMLYQDVRRWAMLWERKIVHRNVGPMFPATNGATIEFIRSKVFQLALQYDIPNSDKDNDGKEFFFNWERQALMGSRAFREALTRDQRPADNYMRQMAMAYWDLELNLKTNAKDYTPIQLLAEFQAFAFKSKSLIGLQVANGLSYESYRKQNPLK